MRLVFKKVVENDPPKPGTTGRWHWYCAKVVLREGTELEIASITSLGDRWQVSFLAAHVERRWRNFDTLADAREEVEDAVYRCLCKRFERREN